MKENNTKNLVTIALFSVFISACAWICVPSVVPFTLQTFGVFLSLIYLGGKKGTLSIILYILLGTVGLPVFSGGSGGIGVLFSLNGGYIFGLLFVGIIFLLFERLGCKKYIQFISLLCGLVICYIIGALHFSLVYFQNGNTITFYKAILLCIVPYIIPDLLKIYISVILGNKLKKLVR